MKILLNVHTRRAAIALKLLTYRMTYDGYVYTHIYICCSYSMVPGIYGSKQTDSKGIVQGQGLFY